MAPTLNALNELAPAAQEWLKAPGSLTQRLRTFTQGAIQFVVLQDENARVALHLSENIPSRIRRIEWRYQNETWISACTIIPITTSDAAPELITGERPIGEILFGLNAPVKLCDFIFYKDSEQHFVRERVIYYKERPLLIKETFLPAFLTQIGSKN